MARPTLSGFERACLLVVALAALLRVTHILHPQTDWDAAWYLLLARSFGDTGTSMLPWTDPPQYDNYWPPLFPIFAAPFVKLFGPSYHSLAGAAVFASALLVVAAFFCTRDLYGRKTAFAVMAAVAASPAFYVSDSRAMSESLLTLMVVLTLWAFLRGLERPAFLALAAVFGALAYLAKASMGVAILAPVVAIGLGWRIWSVGPRVWLQKRYEVGAAVAAVAGLAALALAKPGKIGSLGLGLIGPIAESFTLGFDWFWVFGVKLAFAVVFLLFVTFPFSFAIRQAWRDRRGEREGALWLATILPLLAGALFTTTFYFAQKRPIVDFDNIRYLVPSVVPLMWLTAPRFLAAPPGTRAKERAAPSPTSERWVVASTVAIALVFALSPFAVTPSLPRLGLLAALTLAAVAIALPQFRETRPRDGSLRPTALLGLAAFLTGTAYMLSPLLGSTWRVLLALAVGACLVLGLRDRGLSKAKLHVVAICALVPILGFHVSMWFAMVAAGLLVAMAGRTATTRAVVMAAVLLVSAGPIGSTVAPEDEVAEAVRGLGLPEGSVVGIDQPEVYSAAIMPPGLRVRVVDPEAAPDDVRAMVLSADLREHPGFTLVAAFKNARDPNELLAARLAIERWMGIETKLEGDFSYAVYVRNA